MLSIYIYKILIVSILRWMYWIDMERQGTVNRVNIASMDGLGDIFTIATGHSKFTDIFLDFDLHKIYLSSGDEIVSVDIDGSNETFIASFPVTCMVTAAIPMDNEGFFYACMNGRFGNNSKNATIEYAYDSDNNITVFLCAGINYQTKIVSSHHQIVRG